MAAYTVSDLCQPNYLVFQFSSICLAHKKPLTDLSIAGAHAALNEAITLHPCELIDVTALEGPADYQAIANNQDILTGLDELVHSWCKQIEQVSSYSSLLYMIFICLFSFAFAVVSSISSRNQ